MTARPPLSSQRKPSDCDRYLQGEATTLLAQYPRHSGGAAGLGGGRCGRRFPLSRQQPAQRVDCERPADRLQLPVPAHRRDHRRQRLRPRLTRVESTSRRYQEHLPAGHRGNPVPDDPRHADRRCPPLHQLARSEGGDGVRRDTSQHPAAVDHPVRVQRGDPPTAATA